MKAILAIKLIYQTKAQDWTVALSLDDGAALRFPVGSGEQANTVIRAFEGSTGAKFDDPTGEIVFDYDPVKLDDLLDFGMGDNEHSPPARPPRKSKHRR